MKISPIKNLYLSVTILLFIYMLIIHIDVILMIKFYIYQGRRGYLFFLILADCFNNKSKSYKGC